MSTEHTDVPAPPARISPRRIVLVVLFLLIPIAALAIWLVVPAGQEASTVIMIEGSITPPAVISSPTPLTGDVLNRQAAIAATAILDEGLLRNVMNNQDVRTSKWYKQNPDKQRLFDMLKRSLKVRTTPDTGMITISLRAEDPGDAARIVNTVARYFLETAQRAYLDAYAGRLDALMQQENTLKRGIKQVRDQRESISPQLGLASGVNLPAEMWRFLAVEVARADIEAIRLKIAYEELKGNWSARAPEATTEPAPSATAPADTNLRERLKAAEAEWLRAVQVQIALQERMDAAKAELRDAERKLGQYDALTEDLALLHKHYERVSEDINAVQLMMRDQHLLPARQISMALGSP